jgi:hypothetical protein
MNYETNHAYPNNNETTESDISGICEVCQGRLTPRSIFSSSCMPQLNPASETPHELHQTSYSVVHTSLNMELVDIPLEILIKIIECLTKQSDINHVVRLTKTFFDLFNDYLYQYNVQHFRGNALLWAAWQNHESMARKLLDFGAEVDVREPADELSVENCNPTGYLFIPQGM